MSSALAQLIEHIAENAAKQHPVDVVTDALKDALSGWRYVRQVHGDLYGVGWDRVETKLVAALNAVGSPPAPTSEPSNG